MRDVGEIGENVLGQWAAQVGIAANRVQRDRTGWDFLLEMPESSPLHRKTIPIDRRAPLVQCLVQVKSTDAHPGRWAIKLDNWLRFVTTPLPAFFLILEFDGQKECQRAFLVHVGEELIRRVLARVRELSVTSPDVALHTKTLTFRYGPEHALASSDGSGLLQGINTFVPSLPAYTDAKQQLVRTAGYEQGGQFVSTKVRLPAGDRSQDADDLFVDWALGLTGGATIAPGAEVYDERFGIRLPDPIHVIQTEGRLEPQPRGRGVLRFRSLDGQQERTFEVEIYSSYSVKGYVSDDKHRVRIAAPFGNFFIPFSDPTAMKLALRVPPANLRIPASDLQPLSDFVLLCHEATPANGVEFHLRTEGPSLTGVVDFAAEFSEELLHLAKAVRSCLRIATYLHVQKDFPTTVNEIYSQRQLLDAMDAIYFKNTPDARLTFVAPVGMIRPGDKVCLPAQWDVHLGGRIWVMGVSNIGIPEPTGALESGYQEFVMPVSSVETCYAEASELRAPPKVSRLDVMERVAEACSNFIVIRWWEWADQG